MAENESKVESTTELTPVEEANANKESLHAKIFGPLGLPSGSVRAILVIMVMTAFLYLLCVKPDYYVPDRMWSLVTLMIGWYFMMRKN